jgi:hypothetical protein
MLFAAFADGMENSGARKTGKTGEGGQKAANGKGRKVGREEEQQCKKQVQQE